MPPAFLTAFSRISHAIPRRIDYGLNDLRGDVLGGLSGGSILMPFAIGLGIISGLGPAAGLYGAVAVGIFASLFGGTRGMIYGPTVSTAVIMALVVAEYADSLAEAATIGILAGLIQIAFSVLGLGRYASYIPSSVLSGFLSAIGIMVIVKESLPAIGGTQAIAGVIETIVLWPGAVRAVNFEALALTAIGITFALLRRSMLLRTIPTTLVVLILSISLGTLWLRDAPIIGEIPTGLPYPQLSDISLGFFLRALQPAFIMALISSLTNLLIALHLDTITGAQHKPNQETFAQGMGNIAAGLTGGLPGSAAYGTLVNVSSGGRSPVSGLIVVALIVATLLFLGPVAERIPLAALAAILIPVGWNLIDWRSIVRIHCLPRSYSVPMLLTGFLVLFADIFLAVTIGLAVAVLMGYRRLERQEVSELISVPLLDEVVLGRNDFDKGADPFRARSGLVVFPERVTLASARELGRILRPDIRRHQISIFDFSRTTYVDDSAAAAIGELIAIAMFAGRRTIVFAGLRDDVTDMLHSVRPLDRVPSRNFVTDLEEAKRRIRPMLR